jgi:hypothetical protein
MEESLRYTIFISSHLDRPGRYQWDIQQDGNSCDASYHSFAAKREAHADAQRLVDKLIIIWQKNNRPKHPYAHAI